MNGADSYTILTLIHSAKIGDIWGKKLFQAKLKLDPSKYCEYERILENSGNLTSRCN